MFKKKHLSKYFSVTMAAIATSLTTSARADLEVVNETANMIHIHKELLGSWGGSLVSVSTYLNAANPNFTHANCLPGKKGYFVGDIFIQDGFYGIGSYNSGSAMGIFELNAAPTVSSTLAASKFLGFVSNSTDTTKVTWSHNNNMIVDRKYEEKPAGSGQYVVSHYALVSYPFVAFKNSAVQLTGGAPNAISRSTAGVAGAGRIWAETTTGQSPDQDLGKKTNMGKLGWAPSYSKGTQINYAIYKTIAASTLKTTYSTCYSSLPAAASEAEKEAYLLQLWIYKQLTYLLDPNQGGIDRTWTWANISTQIGDSNYSNFFSVIDAATNHASVYYDAVKGLSRPFLARYYKGKQGKVDLRLQPATAFIWENAPQYSPPKFTVSANDSIEDPFGWLDTRGFTFLFHGKNCSPNLACITAVRSWSENTDAMVADAAIKISPTSQAVYNATFNGKKYTAANIAANSKKFLGNSKVYAAQRPAMFFPSPFSTTDQNYQAILNFAAIPKAVGGGFAPTGTIPYSYNMGLPLYINK